MDSRRSSGGHAKERRGRIMMADKTLLRMKYADVVRLLAERAGLSMEEALKRFYESREYRLVSRGISDQHCMSPDYIVDDILAESR